MFPNYLDGAIILTITHLAEDSENEFVKKIFARINQQPRRKHRGTVLNVSNGMGYPARMPVVPNRNEFFALQKTRSPKITLYQEKTLKDRVKRSFEAFLVHIFNQLSYTLSYKTTMYL